MSARRLTLALVLVVTASAPLSGCRGWTSDDPPVHINPNMDFQEKLKAYGSNDFFADGRNMRQPPEGTIARTLSGQEPRDRDFLELDDHYYRAVVDGQVVNTPPPSLVVDEKLLARGQSRYNIYCAPCHAQHGTGNGLVAERLTIKPPTFHDETRYKKPLGHFYRAIAHGVPLPELRATPDAVNMPSYAMQVPPQDRWAIALYIRALQRVTKGGPLPEAEPMAVGGQAATPTATEAEPVDEDKAETIPALEGEQAEVPPSEKQPVAEDQPVREGVDPGSAKQAQPASPAGDDDPEATQ